MYRCMGCMADLQQNTGACPHCGYVAGTAPAEAYHLGAGTILQGRYIVGRVLGYGGFGVTYIGWDAELERIVAIKEYLPSTFATRMPGDTEITVFEGQATEQYGFGLERFVDEAQRLAQFNGIPGIVDIYDTFSSNKTAYIVMEFLQGRDVKQILAANGPLPYEQAREIVGKVCEALEPVHAKGIIHRDISPDNIYITAEGEVRLLDFGAARYESSVNSKSLSVILKSGYAPEEQYRSKGEQGSWTDVYALAATMYKMLTGVTPDDSMERAIQDELKEPSKLGAEIPESAENALMNALNIRKNDRTQTVGEFSRALGADEVERVKVKQGRVDSGRIPTWGKVLLGGGLGLVLLFALLVSTGVVGFGEDGGVQILPGNTLRDDYGGAVAEGMVMVPNLLGMGETEAAEVLEGLGLSLENGGYSFYQNTTAGLVGQQMPDAGKQVEPGAVVEIKLNGGNPADAIDNGFLPNPVGMDAVASTAIFSGMDTDCYPYYRYVYSDSPAGNVTGYFFNSQNSAFFLNVSAGQNDSTKLGGEPRAPVIWPGRGVLYGRVAIASYDSGADDFYLQEQVNYSLDGANWTKLGARVQNYSDEEEGDPAPFRTMNIWELLESAGLQELEGETIHLQYERTIEEREREDAEKVTSVVNFAQTISFAFDGELELTGSVVYTLGQVAEKYESGEWEDTHPVVQEYLAIWEEYEGYKENGNTQEDIDRMAERRYIAQIMGEYTERYYHVYYADRTSGMTVRADGDSLVFSVQADINGSGGLYVTVAQQDRTVAVSEDGSHISVTTAKPGVLWLPLSEAAFEVHGMHADEALPLLIDHLRGLGQLAPDFGIEIEGGGIKPTVPVGNVLYWDGWQNEQGQYQFINLYLSAGMSAGPYVKYVGSFYNYGEALLLEPRLVYRLDEAHDEMYMLMEYSLDGGATWEAGRTTILTWDDYEDPGGLRTWGFDMYTMPEVTSAMGRVRLYAQDPEAGGEILDECEFTFLPVGYYDA